MTPRGVSGQSNVSVSGGSARDAAARRWAGVTTTIGEVIVGWQSCDSVCATLVREESWTTLANKMT
jgi:hypothetical protein